MSIERKSHDRKKDNEDIVSQSKDIFTISSFVSPPSQGTEKKKLEHKTSILVSPGQKSPTEVKKTVVVASASVGSMTIKNKEKLRPTASYVHLSLTRLPSGSTETAKNRASEEKPKNRKLTRMEILTIISLALGNLCLGTLYALLAPFFPHEAEKKGVSPTLYGLVFGIFEFGQFVFAPLAALLVPKTSLKFTLTIGLFIVAWCTAIFGVLQWSPGGMTYFWLAFVLRLISSTGAACYFIASFTLMATEFGDRISTLFALTEVCFGVGMIIGPSIGGVLFELGGFSLPFFATGTICFLTSLFTLIVLKSPEKPETPSKGVSVFQLVKNLPIMINIMICFTTFVNIGFNDATLEHHLRDFLSLTPTAVGGMFLVSGVVYAGTTQVWGILIQKYDNAHTFVIAGFVFSAASLVLCGPMYPISMSLNPSLTLVIIAQFLYGISMGPQLVGSFTQALTETIDAGFPDDIATSAAVSGLFQSSCSLGAAVGPSFGGYLLDEFGYEKASTALFFLQIIMIVILVIYKFCCKSSSCVKQGNESDEESSGEPDANGNVQSNH